MSLLAVQLPDLDGLTGDPGRLDHLDLVVVQGGGAIGKDALSLAAWLMGVTRTVGLAPAISAAWAPFHVARALASFDHLSGGRAGWRPRPDPEAADAARFAEHTDVVLKLFDSWGDAALVFDKTRAVFADRDQIRRVRHAGAHYTVDGPLNAPRPPQGWPVMVQAIGEADARCDLLVADLATLDASGPDAAGRPRLAAWPTSFAAAEAGDLVAAITAAIADGRCEGVMLQPDRPCDLEPLLEDVAPRLRAIYPARHGGDLRARLGLPRPVRRDEVAA